jgi:hypothetical protein
MHQAVAELLRIIYMLKHVLYSVKNTLFCTDVYAASAEERYALM